MHVVEQVYISSYKCKFIYQINFTVVYRNTVNTVPSTLSVEGTFRPLLQP